MPRQGLFFLALSLLLSGGGWLARGKVPAPASPSSRFEQGRRPQRGVVGSAPLSAKACGRCHKAEYHEWRGSRHAQAWTNPTFRSAFRHHPIAWCVYCHAPLPEQVAAIHPRWAEPNTRPDPALVSEGITCVTCHLRDGNVLSSRPPSAKAQKEHPTLHAPDLKEASFCAGCHQFPFPTQALAKKPTDHPFLARSASAALPKTWHLPHIPSTAEPMQDTYQEWQRSHASKQGKTCQTCHMPKGKHTFPGGRDLAKIRRSLRIEASLEGNKAVFRFHLRGLGHRFPTGDPFRRLALEFSTTNGLWLRSRTLFFRRFALVDDRWRLFADTTLPPPTSAPSRTVIRRVSLPPSVSSALSTSQTPVHWRLRYLYADPQLERYLAPEEASQTLFEGTLSILPAKLPSSWPVRRP